MPGDPDGGAMWFAPDGPDLVLRVRVRPGASRDAIEGIGTSPAGEALMVRVTAPPAEGRANDAVVRLLAKAAGYARSSITVVTGSRSRDKRVRITGADASVARGILEKGARRS